MKLQRKVVGMVESMNPGWEKSWATGGRRDLILECGHEIRRKLSQKVPKHCHCEDCLRLKRANGCSTYYDMKNNVARYQTWDFQMELPRTHARPMTPEEIEDWK